MRGHGNYQTICGVNAAKGGKMALSASYLTNVSEVWEIVESDPGMLQRVGDQGGGPSHGSPSPSDLAFHQTGRTSRASHTGVMLVVVAMMLSMAAATTPPGDVLVNASWKPLVRARAGA